MKQSSKRLVGPLSANEIKSATDSLVRIAQEDCFYAELTQLHNKLPLNKCSRLLPLSPFIDEDNILRVGGRLRHAKILYSTKHPALLSNNHKLSIAIIDHFHKRHLPAGV